MPTINKADEALGWAWHGNDTPKTSFNHSLF